MRILLNLLIGLIVQNGDLRYLKLLNQRPSGLRYTVATKFAGIEPLRWRLPTIAFEMGAIVGPMKWAPMDRCVTRRRGSGLDYTVSGEH